MALFSERINANGSSSKLPNPDVVSQWDEDDVSCWLRQVNLSECVEVFRNRKIDGEELLTLNEEKLWLWAGDLKIRQRIQITKYLAECRSRDPDSPSLTSTIKSKIRKSPIPPPVPQPDYTAGSVIEYESCDEGWDTDFDEDSEDETGGAVEQANADEIEDAYEQTGSVMNQVTNGSPVCNGNRQVSDMVKKFGLNSSTPVLPRLSPQLKRNEEQITNSAKSSPNVNIGVKPQVPKRKPIPRPPTTVVIPNNVKPRPPSIISRPLQLPPPPPTAPKPNINFASSKPVPITSRRNNAVECESPPLDTCDGCVYEIPTSSNTSEHGLSSLEPRIASSTISLLSAGSSSQGTDDMLNPSQLELSRNFLDDMEYEIPDVDSQWSGSSGVSVRSTSSDRPVLPPKVRPMDLTIPPPLPEKPNRRLVEPPLLPARDKPALLKIQAEDGQSKPRHKSSLDGCKQVLSSLFTKMTIDKRSDSTSVVDKLSPDRETVPTMTAAIEMTKSSSMTSLRSTYTDNAAIINTRPLPPVPGEKPTEALTMKDSFQGVKRLSSSSQNAPVGIYLETYPWFLKVERDEAATLLKRSGQSGTYLVRESRRAGECNPFTLTIFFDDKISHLNIRRRPDGKFALGKEKENEKTFTSVEELVGYHQVEPILLTAGGHPIGRTCLLQFPDNRGR